MATWNVWNARAWNKLQTAIHEGFRQLPQADELTAILCDPRGRRPDESAPSLQWPSSSVGRRWARTPRLLIARLPIREPTIPTAVCLADHFPDLVVPESLIRSTVEAAMRLRWVRRGRSRTT